MPQATATVVPGDAPLLVRVSIPRATTASIASLTVSQNGTILATIATNSKSACNATGNGRVCTANASAPIGAATVLTIATYATAVPSGTPVSTATVVTSVTHAETTTLDLATSGALASVSIAFANPTLPYGQATNVPVYVNALDAEDNYVVGPGAFVNAAGVDTPITLAESDAAGTGATVSAMTVTQPGMSVSLVYAGGPIVNATISGSAPGAIGASATASIQCGAAPTSQALYLSSHSTSNVGIARYGIGTTGNVSAVATELTTPFSYLYLSGLAVDDRGIVDAGEAVYFGKSEATVVLSYCPNASQTEVPRHAFVLPASESGVGENAMPWLSVDALGNQYVFGDATLTEYAADSGAPGIPTASTTAPPAVKVIAGSATGLAGSIDGLSVASDGTAYVSTSLGGPLGPDGSLPTAGPLTDAVLAFSPSQTGNLNPERILKNTAAGLLTPLSVALDGSKNVYVLYAADNRTAQTDLGTYAIAEYAASGQSTPVRVLSGSNTSLGTVAGLPGGAIAIVVAADGTLLVLNGTGSTSEIDAFAASANGNTAPTPIVRSASGISSMTLDANGNIYTVDGYAGALNEYDRRGNLLRQIDGTAAGFGFTKGIAVDADGDVSVSSFNAFMSGSGEHSATSVGTTGILTFGPAQSGNVAPLRTLTPSNFFAGQIAYDATGRLYAQAVMAPWQDSTPPIIEVGSFDPGATGSRAPSRTFVDAIAFARDYIGAIAVDGAGDVYAATVAENTVFAYRAGASGSVDPISAYGDTAPSTLGPAAYVDTHGNLYVASCASNSIAVYPVGATTPSRTIAGRNTRIVCPAKIVADATGSVYVYPSFDTAEVLVFAGNANGDVAPIQDIPGFVTSFAIGPGTGPMFGPAPARSTRPTNGRDVRRNGAMVSACSKSPAAPAWCAEVRFK